MCVCVKEWASIKCEERAIKHKYEMNKGIQI